jgi:Fe-S cluster assembly protein SufD
MSAANTTKLKEEFLKQLDALGGAQAKWLAPFHGDISAAKAFFNKEGFPHVRNEEWKYTPISSILSEHLMLPGAVAESKGYVHIQPHIQRFPEAMHLIIENGSYFLTGCITDSGVSVNALSVAAELYPHLLQKHYGQYAKANENTLVALNTAAVNDGALIYLKKNSIAKVPVFVHHVTDAIQHEVFTNHRVLVIAEDGSKAEIVEIFHTIGNFQQVSNTVSELYIGANAELHHYVLHTESDKERNIGNVYVHQERDSRFHAYSVSVEGEFIRNNLNIEIHGSGAENHMWGLYLLKDSMHVDNHTLVDHKVPLANSNEHYKGILTGRATGVFNGKIFVRRDAQKTNAFQSNNNLLLSNDSTINTKPQLEIFADDVKCSHGATIGQLQEEPIFYLRSRGLDEAQAKKLLVRAFAEEIVEKVAYDQLKKWLEEKIDAWFNAHIQ